MLCRVLPPLRTPYRVIVENISSRTSWQVRMLSVCVCTACPLHYLRTYQHFIGLCFSQKCMWLSRELVTVVLWGRLQCTGHSMAWWWCDVGAEGLSDPCWWSDICWCTQGTLEWRVRFCYISR